MCVALLYLFDVIISAIALLQMTVKLRSLPNFGLNIMYNI